MEAREEEEEDEERSGVRFRGQCIEKVCCRDRVTPQIPWQKLGYATNLTAEIGLRHQSCGVDVIGNRVKLNRRWVVWEIAFTVKAKL